MSDVTELENAWHAGDCLGYPGCDGCGYIADDMLWYPGPCPPADRPHQMARSERGERFEMPLTLAPIGLRAANAWVVDVHRHHGPTRGHKFSVAAKIGDDIVGVAIAGRPVARMLDDGTRLEVLRCAVLEGTYNACSMLYAAAARAGEAMGYRREDIFTYVLESEHGSSLKAAGWVKVAESGGGSWSRPSRLRLDEHPTEPKTRWHAAAGDTGEVESDG